MKQLTFASILMLCPVVYGAANRPNVSSIPTEITAGSSLQDFQCVGGALGLRLPETLTEVLRLGVVIDEQVEQIENWEGYTATRKEINFDGLTLGIMIFSNAKDRVVISGAKIFNSSWRRISPFYVGQAVADAQKLLGGSAPLDVTLKARYGSESSTISFESHAGKITKIYYDCYTG